MNNKNIDTYKILQEAFLGSVHSGTLSAAGSVISGAALTTVSVGGWTIPVIGLTIGATTVAAIAAPVAIGAAVVGGLGGAVLYAGCEYQRQQKIASDFSRWFNSDKANNI
ncbi:hypothetical protein FACS189419_06970 [Planctomycetales bacterium]|nr:hypothetical protein FACS189419_06970 [Planctomycetales bacterium]